MDRKTLSQIIQKCEEVFSSDDRVFKGLGSNEVLARDAACYLIRRKQYVPSSVIAEVMGVSEPSACKAEGRALDRIKTDGIFRQKVDSLMAFFGVKAKRFVPDSYQEMNDHDFVRCLVEEMARSVGITGHRVGLGGQIREIVAIKQATVFFLTEYYGWSPRRILENLPFASDPSVISRSKKVVKGYLESGHLKEMYTDLMRVADSSFVPTEKGRWTQVFRRAA